MASEPQQFDPFADRLSRDIRNGLSKALMGAIADHKPERVEAAANQFFLRASAPVYRQYIDERLAHYRLSLEEIDGLPSPGVWEVMQVLWNHRLFFEVHELVEEAWMVAQGEEKLVLQAMVRAAGVYVKLAQGNEVGARLMAEKAVAVLTRHRAALPAGFPVDSLAEKLNSLDPEPFIFPMWQPLV